MQHIITATEARRRFFQLLNAVEAGESFTITWRGVPIAELKPVGSTSR
jgi:prevent-host-death family protein